VKLIAVASLALALAACRGSRASAPAADGSELIGTTPPPLDVTDWIESPPLTLDGLRGKVVLVRWFMSTDCPYCTATAPALNALHAEFKDRGLVVLGMYHHKRPEAVDANKVAGWAQDYGFKFPVAIDPEWRTLNRWWLTQHRDFTSVSFLIDRAGVIRRIHPGGSMALGSKDYQAMRSTIENLLGGR
jgi:peroxiredoxin